MLKKLMLIITFRIRVHDRRRPSRQVRFQWTSYSTLRAVHSLRGPSELAGHSEIINKDSGDNISEDVHALPFGDSIGKAM